MVLLEMADRRMEGKHNATKCRKPIGVKQGSPRDKQIYNKSGSRRNGQRKDHSNMPSSPTNLVAQLFQRLESQKTQMIFFNQRMLAEIQNGGLGHIPSKVDGEDSDDDMYAGSRFEHAPAATVLPRPPTSWMAREPEESYVPEITSDVGSTLSSHLKMLLKVQA